MISTSKLLAFFERLFFFSSASLLLMGFARAFGFLRLSAVERFGRFPKGDLRLLKERDERSESESDSGTLRKSS